MNDGHGRRWDVIVIGGGPAGSVAARQCALRGLSVLVVERARFPRHKACGCCLSAVGLDTLDQLDLGEAVRRAAGPTLDRLALHARRQQITLGLPPGLSISRATLDATLSEQAADAGATVRFNVTASVGRAGDRGREVIIDADGERSVLIGRWIIAATGLRPVRGVEASGLIRRAGRRSRIGCAAIVDEPEGFAPGAIHMICGSRGYVGLSRLEDGRLDIAAAIDPRASHAAGGPGRLIRAIIAEAGADPPAGLDEAAWLGTPRLTGRPRRVAGERLLLVGDAAGYVEPFTGEGMAWAMMGGAAAATAIGDGAAAPAVVERRWAADHRRLFAARHRRCRAIAALLRSPRLTAGAIGMMRLNRRLADALIGAIHRPATLRYADPSVREVPS